MYATVNFKQDNSQEVTNSHSVQCTFLHNYVLISGQYCIHGYSIGPCIEMSNRSSTTIFFCVFKILDNHYQESEGIEEKVLRQFAIQGWFTMYYVTLHDTTH